MSVQIPHDEESCLPPGRSRRSLPKEAKDRRLALFADGRMPTKDEKRAVFDEIKDMKDTEWYTAEQHDKWCSGRKVHDEKHNQDRMTGRTVQLIREWSEMLGVSDDAAVYRIIRDIHTQSIIGRGYTGI
ncbi:hypothetical protein LXA43DRAFT_1062698 [Ganoderma leucocontextum]|nr:hypothetical protein LXA43DRAFT_1062698 [Ganoderma leucocontextum]